MTFLLVFLLVTFLLIKSAPLMLRWFLRRQQRKYEERIREAFGQEDNNAAERTTKRARYEEVVSEEAEYIDIAGPREEVSQESFTVEEQIVDAEFEDI